MMLGTDSEFVTKFFAARKYWDINVGQWTASGGAPDLCTHEALVRSAMLYSAYGIMVAIPAHFTCMVCMTGLLPTCVSV